MIDPKDIWPLIARTEIKLPNKPDSIRGTAFLISKTHMLTCAHCIGDKDTNTLASHVKLTFSRWQDPKELSAAVDPDLISWECDVAIITLNHQDRTKELSIPPLQANGVTDQAWKLCAHPRPSSDGGIVFDRFVPAEIAHEC